MDFSKKFDELLELLGISNSKFAKAINVDPSLISRWRRGTRSPLKNPEQIQTISSCIANNVPKNSFQRLLLLNHLKNWDKSLDDDFNSWKTELLSKEIALWLTEDSKLGAELQELTGLCAQRDNRIGTSSALDNGKCYWGKKECIESIRLFFEGVKNKANSNVYFFAEYGFLEHFYQYAYVEMARYLENVLPRVEKLYIMISEPFPNKTEAMLLRKQMLLLKAKFKTEKIKFQIAHGYLCGHIKHSFFASQQIGSVEIQTVNFDNDIISVFMTDKIKTDSLLNLFYDLTDEVQFGFV